MRVTELVLQQIADRWSAADAQLVVAALESRQFPPYVEEERVSLAILKLLLDGGSPEVVSRMDDWRDILVSAGLDSADWREVLSRAGMRAPP